jgi:HAMP domain-containing protein
LGVTGIDIDVMRIQEMVSAIEPIEGGLATVLSNAGFVIGHSDSSHVGKHVSETGQTGIDLDRLKAALKDGKDLSYSGRLPGVAGELFFIGVPFTMGDTTTPWMCMIGVPKRTINAPIYRMVVISGVIGLLTLLVISVAAFYMSRSLSKPLKVMMETFIAMGDQTAAATSPFLRRLPHNLRQQRNEIGELANAFSTMSASVQEVIDDIELITNAAREGRLHKRANTAALKGSYLHIVSGVNTAMDTVCAQLDVIPEAEALFSHDRELLYYNREMSAFLDRHGFEYDGPQLLSRLFAAGIFSTDIEDHAAPFFDPAGEAAGIYTADLSFPVEKVEKVERVEKDGA